MANESFALEIQNDDEGRFRERPLLFALHQLERAWTLLQGRTHQNDLRIVVRLVQGLCAAEITGGASYAMPFPGYVSREIKRGRGLSNTRKKRLIRQRIALVKKEVESGETGLRGEQLVNKRRTDREMRILRTILLVNAAIDSKGRI